MHLPDVRQAPLESIGTVTDQVHIDVLLPDSVIEDVASRVAAILRGERLAEAEGAAASPYLTVVEAADFLRCKRQRIDDLLSQGRLARHKDGSRTLLRRSELTAYVEGHVPGDTVVTPHGGSRAGSGIGA